jgi:hypothetical protein
VSAVNSDELDAIVTLKDTNGIITTSLENDLLVLREQHRNLTTDFEVQKTQLLETLLSKDRLMQDLASLKERTGTSENKMIESAKARSTKEAELEEVRSLTASATKSPPTSLKQAKILFCTSGIRSSSKTDQVETLFSPRPIPSYISQASPLSPRLILIYQSKVPPASPCQQLLSSIRSL